MPITLADLFSPQDYSFDFPDVPDYAYGYEDIPKSKRKNHNQALLSSLAQAIGGGFDSGHLGSALAAAAAQIQPRKDREVEEYRAQQDRGFAARERQAEKQAQLLSVKQRQDLERQKAERVLAVYQQTQGTLHPADQASAARLDAAARALDIDEIQKIGQAAAERGSMYTQGINPDDPMAVAKKKHDEQIAQYEEQQQLQMKYQFELEKQKRAAGLTAPPNDPVQTAIAIQQGLADRGLGSYKPELIAKYLSEISARESRPDPVDPLAKLAAESSKDPLTGEIDWNRFEQNKKELERRLRGGGATPPAAPQRSPLATPTGPGGKPPVNPLKPPTKKAESGYPASVMQKPAVRAKILDLEKKGVPREQILKLLKDAGLI